MSADVNFKLVMQLRANIKNKVNIEEMASGINKRRVIQRVVFDEVCILFLYKSFLWLKVHGTLFFHWLIWTNVKGLAKKGLPLDDYFIHIKSSLWVILTLWLLLAVRAAGPRCEAVRAGEGARQRAHVRGPAGQRQDHHRHQAGLPL